MTITPTTLLAIAFRFQPLVAEAAASNKMTTGFSYIIYVMMLAGMVWGVQRAMAGFGEMDGHGGMDGMIKVGSGVGIALAPWIIYFIFKNIFPQAAIDPSTIQSLQ